MNKREQDLITQIKKSAIEGLNAAERLESDATWTQRILVWRAQSPYRKILALLRRLEKGAKGHGPRRMHCTDPEQQHERDGGFGPWDDEEADS